MIYPPLNNNEKKLNLATVKREVIFVLDTSAQCPGTSLNEAKQALLVALSGSSIPPIVSMLLNLIAMHKI